MTKEVTKDNPVIAWWSGGVTSAVADKIAIDLYGAENVRIVFIDTFNEDKDTYRFKGDCEKWYGKEIETIFNPEYRNIKEVWYKYLSLNTAHGAICSTELKRKTREIFQRENNFSHQVFGYEIEEWDRAKALGLNHPDSSPIFTLVNSLVTKPEAARMIVNAGIRLPDQYIKGFLNNNCAGTGCVQGGIGYWKKMEVDSPDAFDEMAIVEHALTELKGKPVTILKDQSKTGGLVFLKHNPKYPHMKDLSMMKGRKIKPLMDCNGFCGTHDLKKVDYENEINYQD